MPLAWRTRRHDNGLLGALETADHFLESGDPLLALGQGTRRKKQKTGIGLVPRLRCDQAARETSAYGVLPRPRRRQACDRRPPPVARRGWPLNEEGNKKPRRSGAAKLEETPSQKGPPFAS